MTDWLFWLVAGLWWLLGAPLMMGGMLYLAYWMAEKRKDKKK